MGEQSPKRKLFNIVLLCCAAVLLVGVVNYFLNGRGHSKKIGAAELMERYQSACQEAGLEADWEAMTFSENTWNAKFAAGEGQLMMRVEQNDKGFLKAAQFQWDTGSVRDEEIRPWVDAMFLCADVELSAGDLDSVWYNLTDESSIKKKRPGGRHLLLLAAQDGLLLVPGRTLYRRVGGGPGGLPVGLYPQI